MKIYDIFPRDTLPNVFKKKKFKKTNKVPKARKSSYGVGIVGLNVPAGESEGSNGADSGGGDGGGGGGE